VNRAAGLLAAAAVVTLASCTGSDQSIDPFDSVEPSTIATTIPIVGSTAELLGAMATEVSQLSAQVSEDGDAEEATLAAIVATWAIVEPQVRAARPELVASFQTTVDMATSAVQRKRPADADKASILLHDLVDSFNAGG
jgi:hypothetical protein